MSWAFSPLLPGASPSPAGQLGYVKIWMGSSWICKPVKVWNGSQWVIETAKWYDTSTSSWITPICADPEPPAGTARSYLGASSNGASSTTSVTVSTPEGAANGDLLVALLDSGVAHSVPAGWTKVDGSTGRGEQIFTATHDGVATSYTFTTSASASQAVVLSAYRGYSFGVCSAFSTSGAGAPLAPAITVPVNDSIVVVCGLGSGTTIRYAVAVAGWTSNYEQQVLGSRNIFQRDTLAPSGSLAATQLTITAGIGTHTAAQFSLSPV